MAGFEGDICGLLAKIAVGERSVVGELGSDRKVQLERSGDGTGERRGLM